MRNKAILFPLIFGMLAATALGSHDNSTVGSAPSWDANLTYLGTFSGNDDPVTVAAAIFAATGINVNVALIGRSDPPGTPNNGLSVTCTGGCASTSGTWSYTGSDTVAYLVVKAGNNFALYRIENGATSGNWQTSDLVTGGASHPAVSHISVYSSQSTVPEPASIFLLGSALLGLGFLRRKL